MANEGSASGPSFGTVAEVIKLLEPLSEGDRQHILRTIATWYRIELSPPIEPRGALPVPSGVQPPNGQDDDKFLNRPVLSVKDFVFEKNPETEAERMACLAYYLTHYRETPHFKTVDLTRLNIEAAQRSFSNPAVTSSNAIRDGYFVSAPKAGFKQLSAMGERFVHALPDRVAADEIKERMGARRSRRKVSNHSAPEGEQANSEDNQGA